MIGIIMGIGNLICLIGTLLQIKEVVKNREALRGYSFLGSLLTFMAMIFFLTGFILLSLWTSVFLAIPTLVYWFLVTLYLMIVKALRRSS